MSREAASILFMPCKHLTMCTECFVDKFQGKECIMCGQEYESKMAIKPFD